jgi:hypothetical protein
MLNFHDIPVTQHTIVEKSGMVFHTFIKEKNYCIPFFKDLYNIVALK